MTLERRFQVGWNNLDANAHMANTAYLEMTANVRIMYFDSARFWPTRSGSSGSAGHQERGAVGPGVNGER